MKNLINYMPVFEMGRPKGSKNKPKVWPNDSKEIENDPEIKNATKVDDVDTSKIKPMKNGDHGKKLTGDDAQNKTLQKKGAWSVDSPVDDWEAELTKFLEKDGQLGMSRNERKIAKRLATKRDFYVQGEAGWAKTSIIEAIAKKYGYHILTVYLDKAVASDLGGIPVASRNEDTNALYMEYSVPGWALHMMEHPNDKFLLFFDEMNQAQPDVLNALMPIVLKHVVCSVQFDNFIVGAAGNYNTENGAVQSIDENKPLRDRFKPIITWETHSDDAWKSTFDYFHKKFDNKIGKEIIDGFSDLTEYLNSPRDIERVFFEILPEMKKGKNAQLTDVEDIMDDLSQIVWDDKKAKDGKLQDSDAEDKFAKLAEKIYDWINGKTSTDDDDDTKTTENTNLSEEEISAREEDYSVIQDALENGYLVDEDNTYLASVDNIVAVLCPPEITGFTAEMLRKLVKKMKADGRPPKYNTVDEGREDAKRNGWHVAELIDGKDYLDGKEIQGYVIPHHLKRIKKTPKQTTQRRQSHSND